MRQAGTSVILVSYGPNNRTLKLSAVFKRYGAAPWLIVILSVKSCQMGISHLCLLIACLCFFLTCLAVEGACTHSYFALGTIPRCKFKHVLMDSVDLNLFKQSFTSLILPLSKLEWGSLGDLHLITFSLNDHNCKISVNILWKLKFSLQANLTR